MWLTTRQARRKRLETVGMVLSHHGTGVRLQEKGSQETAYVLSQTTPTLLEQ